MPKNESISDLIVLEGKAAAIQKAPQRFESRLDVKAIKQGRAEPLAELLKRKPGPLLEYKEAIERVRERGIVLKHHLGPGQSITLSPRVNWIEGHGHLNFINVRHLFGENNQAWFMTDDDQPDTARKLEIWLTGLTVGASFLVQIRVSGDASRNFEIRGSDTAGVTHVPGGLDRTIPVLVHEVQYSMSLVTIHAIDMWQWGFYDATITAM